MKTSKLLFPGALALALLGWLVVPVTQARAPSEEFVPQTGHWVRGAFLEFYRSSPDALLLFGYPITDAFEDALSGRQVQYFQKARFDLSPSGDGTTVELAPLGSWLYEPESEAGSAVDTGGPCRHFSSGFDVCEPFLSFYQRYEGERFFGDPIGPMEVRTGRLMQYFERARVEWWPEKPGGDQVQLADLGRIYFGKAVNQPSLLRPLPPNESLDELIEPQAHAFAGKALTSNGETQDLYIVVWDRYLQPVAQATVGVTLSFADGSQEFYRAPSTGEDGISHLVFTPKAQPNGSVVTVKVTVSAHGESADTATWFRIWW